MTTNLITGAAGYVLAKKRRRAIFQIKDIRPFVEEFTGNRKLGVALNDTGEQTRVNSMTDWFDGIPNSLLYSHFTG